MEEETNIEIPVQEEIEKKSNWRKYVGLGVLVIFLLLLLALFSVQKEEAQTVEELDNDDAWENLLESQEDIVLIAAGSIYNSDGERDFSKVELYNLNLDTNELFLLSDPSVDKDYYWVGRIEQYDGLPEIIPYRTGVDSYILSRDGSEVLVRFATYDPEIIEGFGGSSLIIEQSEFRCIVVEERCYPSDIWSKAGKELGKYFNPEASPEFKSYFNCCASRWVTWDPLTRQLFGYTRGEGGPIGPVYTYDETLNKLAILPNTEEKGGIIAGANSSFEQIFVVVPRRGATGESGKTGVLYQKKDAKYEIIGEYEIPLTDRIKISRNTFRWSDDLSKIIFTTTTKMYGLDIESGELRLLIDAEPLLVNRPDVLRVGVDFSPSGRYVYFTEKVGDMPVLKKVDLKDGSEISDVMSEESIRIDVF